MSIASLKLYMLNSMQHFGKRILGTRTQSSHPFSATMNFSDLGKFVYMLLNFTEFQNKKSSRKTSPSALLTKPKPLTVDHNKLQKILKEMAIPGQIPDLPPEKPVCKSRSNS